MWNTMVFVNEVRWHIIFFLFCLYWLVFCFTLFRVECFCFCFYFVNKSPLNMTIQTLPDCTWYIFITTINIFRFAAQASACRVNIFVFNQAKWPEVCVCVCSGARAQMNGRMRREEKGHTHRMDILFAWWSALECMQSGYMCMGITRYVYIHIVSQCHCQDSEWYRTEHITILNPLYVWVELAIECAGTDGNYPSQYYNEKAGKVRRTGALLPNR